ncbi:MAG: DUF4942 domain-containing protein [Lachnospiraceae bacterium]|nr:DUF4942 domain-containing protein [Lachnospiraceae bacterium]
MDTEQFYPTPKELLEKIFKDTDWGKIFTVLEPSAGNGDICDYIRAAADQYPYYNRNLDIDCIEINVNRQAALKGKGYRVVYDDFLRFETHKQYDLIAMNPPFSEGEKHLLKALEMQRNGGSILCILNAETLRNPYTKERKLLVRKLEEAGAVTEYFQSAFSQAEVPTDVEAAVVKVCIPRSEDVSYIFEQLRKSRKYAEKGGVCEHTDVAVDDIVEAIVRQCEMEMEAGISLIREYRGMEPEIMDSFDSGYKNPIITMKIGNSDVSVNRYVKAVRRKYWSALFQNPKFTKGMTSEMQGSYMSKVSRLENYDFNRYNIRTIQIEMSRHMAKSIEKCIGDLFDELSYHYSMECGKNIHYFNGWKTNKAWIINRKVVIPVHDVFCSIFHKFQYRYSVCQKLSDIEKVFDYLAGISPGSPSLPYILQDAENRQESKNIGFRYFTCSFYKKGTCHMVFKDEEFLKKFNIFGARQKGWLPPAYGRKAYHELDKEEREAVDSFEGKDSYAETCSRPEYYLYEPEDRQDLLGLLQA